MELPSYEGTFISESPRDLQLEIEKFAHGCRYDIQEERGEVNLIFRDIVLRLGLIGVTSRTFAERMRAFHDTVKQGVNAIFQLEGAFYLRIVAPWTVRLEAYIQGRTIDVATFPWCVELAYALTRVYMRLDAERSR